METQAEPRGRLQHLTKVHNYEISTRRSRVELREHHSISHQVIKVVVFQLPTPSGLALVHAQCLRSVYVANRCSGIHCKARDPHVEAWRVGCHLSRPPRHLTEVPNHTVYERRVRYTNCCLIDFICCGMLPNGV
ncbi:uncharacterized protein TNCV_4853221 [Trichonephila clavipes]|nr:uncharacterized protein TNCV_4853221 [Trichonephila clavipes]